MSHLRYSRQHPYNPQPADEARMGWTIWWDMHRRAGSEGWSRAVESSQDQALERAERFLKLGFVVYAIRSPRGEIVMDETQIVDHVAARDHLGLPKVGLCKRQH